MWKLLGYLLIIGTVLPAHAEPADLYPPPSPESCAEPEYPSSPNDKQNAVRLSPLISAAEWKTAEMEAKAILKQEPGNFLALTMLGIARQGSGDAAGAIDAFKEALDLRSNAHAVRAMLGSAYKQAGLYEEANNAYNLAFACVPNSQNLSELADIALRLHDYEFAALAYSVLLIWNPNDVLVWMQAILANTLANELDDASRLLNKLKRENPPAARCVTRLIACGAPCCSLDKDPDCVAALEELH